MRAAVVVFPGSNADAEMIRTLRDVAGIPTEVAWHKDAALPPATDLVVLPGGFSFGDYLRSGAIAKASAIMADVKRHAERGGLVLGVCNGFQILVEAALLPGALARNAHLRFSCHEVFVTVRTSGPFTHAIVGRTLRLPIAHGEGRYVPDPSRPPSVALTYTDSAGVETTHANPNGSHASIAGIYGGPVSNVLGLMPHPERMSETHHGGVDGRLLFESAASWFAAHAPSTSGTLEGRAP
ncbi:MAG: phosphoribosylformylglycinamidine synthase subunit PurQ [Polyangiaceae bacterium]